MGELHLTSFTVGGIGRGHLGPDGRSSDKHREGQAARHGGALFLAGGLLLGPADYLCGLEARAEALRWGPGGSGERIVVEEASGRRHFFFSAISLSLSRY